jgi:hypothetical protein
VSRIILKRAERVEGRLYVEVEPVSVPVGAGAATVLTKLIGLPTLDDDQLFDLYKVDLEGEPIADSVGQMRSSLVESPGS